jgi:hypothetical protein
MLRASPVRTRTRREGKEVHGPGMLSALPANGDYSDVINAYWKCHRYPGRETPH